MREIKFRAFWGDTLKLIADFSDEYVIDAINDEVFIVNQFTGLKDAEGNEIYEGDILRDIVETEDGTVFSYQQVFWDDKHAMWALDASFDSDKSYTEPIYSALEDFDYVVVGNIHQNPELLKTK